MSKNRFWSKGSLWLPDAANLAKIRSAVSRSTRHASLALQAAVVSLQGSGVRGHPWKTWPHTSKFLTPPPYLWCLEKCNKIPFFVPPLTQSMQMSFMNGSYECRLCCCPHARSSDAHSSPYCLTTVPPFLSCVSREFWPFLRPFYGDFI